MSEASQINDGSVGPAQKPVFNPKEQKLTQEVVEQKAKKLGEKALSIVGAGMKRNVIIQKPDGKEVARVPLTLFVLIIILSQLLVLVAAAVLVVFFKWKIELEEKRPPTENSHEVITKEQPTSNNPILK